MDMDSPLDKCKRERFKVRHRGFAIRLVAACLPEVPTALFESVLEAALRITRFFNLAVRPVNYFDG